MDGPSHRTSKPRRRILKGVSANVVVLGVVSLLTDMSSEMIIPILPFFLVSVGATGLLIGLIEGAAEATASLLKVPSGWFSDRIGRRKPFILAGYGSSALVKPLLIIATAPWHVLGIRISERVGKGVRSAPRDALIADSTECKSMGLAFGFHKFMDTFGAILGVIGLILLALAMGIGLEGNYDAEDYKTIFTVAAVPALASVLVIILFVREKVRPRCETAAAFFRDMSGLGRGFWLLMIVVMAFYIAEVNVAFFLLKGEEGGLSITSVLLLYLLFNISFALLATVFGGLSDRFGRKPVIAASFAVFAVTCLVMAAADCLWMLVLGFGALGVYKAASEGVFKAYVVDSVGKEMRGSALGAFHTGVGLVMLPGGIIAGLLWDSVGSHATFLFGAAMAVISLVLLAVVAPKERFARPATTA
jgi:MFS family permease